MPMCISGGVESVPFRGTPPAASAYSSTTPPFSPPASRSRRSSCLCGKRRTRFPAHGRGSFKGLPGLLADALPDKFGNRLIDVWLAETGARREDFSPVDRLCYIGKRAVGALEFEPAPPQA